MNIAVITGTTREGRMTPRLSKWVLSAAQSHQDATFTHIDLKNYDIPMLSEAPWLPDRILNDDTKRWLDDLAAADGYIFVTAEYNHTVPAVFKNAIDYTQGQLKRKPVAIVSHGVNSGVRANEHLRQIVNSMIDAVPISAAGTFFGNLSELLDEEGNAVGENQVNDKTIANLLNDIVWYTGALKAARERE